MITSSTQMALVLGLAACRTGIVGPLETMLARFEGLAKLGLNFCRVIPGSRDAAPDVVSISMVHLATEVRPAVVGSATPV
jgi:hypothetical protein